MQRISFKTVLALAFAITFPNITSSALADSPLAIPNQYMVCSNNNKYCAVFDKETGVNAYEVFNNISIPLWHLSKQVWPGFISNDGRYLVEASWNLIPTNYKKSMPMIKVYRDGVFKYSLQLKDLIKDFRKLERTISHFHWGDMNKGFDSKGRFIVETVENRRLAIDVKTGKITEQ
jgi:hypothetical protein